MALGFGGLVVAGIGVRYAQVVSASVLSQRWNRAGGSCGFGGGVHLVHRAGSALRAGPAADLVSKEKEEA